MRVGAFVDGFNLYHGVRDEMGHAHLWIDVRQLCASLLKPGQELRCVHYFTAYVRNQPESLGRQQTYLQAVKGYKPGVTIHPGRFQEKTVECLDCHHSYTTYEEKESDVWLASKLIESTVNDEIDMALLVSADSDFIPAIKTAKRLRPGLRVVAAMPPGRNSGKLARACDASFPIGSAKVRQAQFPEEMVLATGASISRPEYWSTRTDTEVTDRQIANLARRFNRR